MIIIIISVITRFNQKYRAKLIDAGEYETFEHGFDCHWLTGDVHFNVEYLSVGTLQFNVGHGESLCKDGVTVMVVACV